MSVFAIGDLHLPLSVDKPMDIFGKGWENYIERLSASWQETVSEDDLVLLCGDTSWATYLSDAVADFSFIEHLPGKKMISKGNHDYWWTTMNKLNQFASEQGFSTIRFVHNNAFLYGDVAVCASRGYWLDEKSNLHDKKIYDRELIRLTLSVEAGKKLNPSKIILALHYPPDEKFVETIHELGVDECVFGHLHGESALKFQPIAPNFHLVSSDFLQFTPEKIME